MFTIVTVYNKRDYFERVLLASLQKQTAQFELIAIDNTAERYKSAAQAFNSEIRNPKGEYILFVHQDVDFGDDTEWLRTAEEEVRKLLDAGIMGVLGVDFEGNFRGYISDCGEKRVKKEAGAVEVQSVDELLFIIPKRVFDTIKFDEVAFDGWHLYGVDYCITVQQHNLKTYVIPSFVYHRSVGTNRIDIIKYQRRLFLKYKSLVFTSIGVINWVSFIKSFVQQLIGPIYSLLFPDWIPLLKKEADGFTSILDLECGYNSPVQHLRITRKVGVDDNEEYIEESRKKALHQEYIRGNVLEIVLPIQSFDVVFSSRTGESLSVQEREKLLETMQELASKKVIVMVQNGPHWMVSDFEQRGFRVYGIGGFKFLRTPTGGIRYRPWYLFAFLSDLSEKIAYFFPSLAFRLFAVKDV
ncbi:MAG TPA: glycosyltransferase [Candidatus Paceibacterota bacterium]